MKYDYKKAMKIIEENKSEIESAYMGMAEDWGWTAEPVYEDGEYKQDLTKEDLCLAGINGSYWATPTLKIEYKNGFYKDFACEKSE
jgi:hypothetical protein